MSSFSDSHVSRLLFATPALDRVVGLTARRWRRLAAPLFDPYRPELHYMRGPGPKWREKHARDVEGRHLHVSLARETRSVFCATRVQ